MDGKSLKLIGGKGIESKSSFVKDETSYTEGYIYDNFQENGGIGDQNNPRRSERRDK